MNAYQFDMKTYQFDFENKEYLDYQIPVTQQMEPKGNGDTQAAKRD